MRTFDVESASAWEDRRIRSEWIRTVVTAFILFMLALIALLALSLVVGSSVQRAERIRSTGPVVQATVLENSTGSLRCNRSRTLLRYSYAGRDHEGYLRSGGCGGPELEQGQHIPIFVDASHPARFVTADDDNESRGMYVAFLLGTAMVLLILIAAPIQLASSWRLRSLLRAAPWRERHGLLYGRGYIQLEEDEATPGPLLHVRGALHKAGLLPDQWDPYKGVPVVVQTASRPDKKTWVVRSAPGERPLKAKQVKAPRDLLRLGSR